MPSATTESVSTAHQFDEHECVRVGTDILEAGVTKGMLGAIVYVYPDGLTYEVEIPDAKPGFEVLTLKAASLFPSEDDNG